MASGLFDADIRVLMCASCGAALEAGLEGGTIPCGYCGVQNLVTVRDERPDLGKPALSAVDEDTRLARLRAQDAVPETLPESVRGLVSGDRLDPAKTEAALASYLEARRELQEEGRLEAEHRLYALTLLANELYAQQGDDRRRRAWLETTLELVWLPRHRQVLRCLLSESAARDGELDDAERWLGPCDARSQDLEADSAYRLARALLDTFAGRHQAVIEVLGAHDGAVPMLDARERECVALRANALEELGRNAAAVEALRSRLSREEAEDREGLEAYIRRYPELELCTQTLPLALEQARAAVRRRNGGWVDWTFVAIGVCSGGLGLAFWAAGPSGVGMAPVGSWLLGAGALFTMLGGLLLWRSHHRNLARYHGVLATAEVVDVRDTWVEQPGRPIVALSLRYRRDGHGPFEVRTRHAFTPEEIERLRAGAGLRLRAHPTRSEWIHILELQDGG